MLSFPLIGKAASVTDLDITEAVSLICVKLRKRWCIIPWSPNRIAFVRICVSISYWNTLSSKSSMATVNAAFCCDSRSCWLISCVFLSSSSSLLCIVPNSLYITSVWLASRFESWLVLLLDPFKRLFISASDAEKGRGSRTSIDWPCPLLKLVLSLNGSSLVLYVLVSIPKPYQRLYYCLIFGSMRSLIAAGIDTHRYYDYIVALGISRPPTIFLLLIEVVRG